MPQAGHALLRLRCAGICNTDLELQRGYYNFRGVPGHEFVADVLAATSDSLVGRRVVGEINLACGTCEECSAGMQRHCRNRTVLGIKGHPGAFAELLSLPENNLWPVPDHVSDEEAVFVEPLAAACAILEQITIEPQEPVAIVGDGKLGLLIAQVLQHAGASVTIVGHHPERKVLVPGCHYQAQDTQYRVTVECSGSRNGLERAIAMTRPRGKIVLKSTITERVNLDLVPVIVNEISLIGSRCGQFQTAIQLLGSGAIKVKPLIAARFALDEAAEAFRHAASPGVLKVLLTPGLRRAV